MQTPPPISKPKKNKTGLIILIVISALIILCVVIVLVSTSWAKTPEGIASLTQGSLNKTSTFLNVTIEPTNTPKPENSQQPTKTIKPSKTAILSNTPIPTNTPQPTITPTPTKELSGLTFEEIKAFKENATDIQWDEYKKQINGKRVSWTGTIYNVDKQGNGYFIFICMDSYCNSVSFNLSDKDIALGLNKAQTVTFEGYIDTTLMDFLAINFNISLDSAKIIN